MVRKWWKRFNTVSSIMLGLAFLGFGILILAKGGDRWWTGMIGVGLGSAYVIRVLNKGEGRE